jgi:hypothetical protein
MGRALAGRDIDVAPLIAPADHSAPAPEAVGDPRVSFSASRSYTLAAPFEEHPAGLDCGSAARRTGPASLRA